MLEATLDESVNFAGGDTEAVRGGCCGDDTCLSTLACVDRDSGDLLFVTSPGCCSSAAKDNEPLFAATQTMIHSDEARR